MKNKILKIASAILGVAAVVLIACVVVKHIAINKGNEKLNQLADEVKTESQVPDTPEITMKDEEPLVEETTEISEETEVVEEEIKEKIPYISPIDFETLTGINTDIYAWIEIPNMDISYPVLQREGEDQFYLIHSYEGGSNGGCGSIYTHDENNKDFNDFNTIIYGHNLYQGGMFTDLEMYFNETFREEHREIIIYTPERELHYKLYGVVVYNDYLLDYLFDFGTEEGQMAYIQSLSETNNLRTYIYDDMKITPDDKVITLSTCVSGSGGSKRLLIVAKLETVIDEGVADVAETSEAN